VTFQFKDGIPAYLVRAKGHDLQIALGRAGDGDDAKDDVKSSKEDSKHGATAKKHGKEGLRRSGSVAPRSKGD
jgi:hypothetical protein